MIRSFEYERYQLDSFFAQLHPLTKMTLLSFVSIILILVDQNETLIVLNIIVLILFLFSKLSTRLIWVGLGIMALNVYSLMISQALFYQMHPRTLLFSFGEIQLFGVDFQLHFWREGFYYGMKSSLRLNAPFLLAYLLFFTTSPQDVLNALRRLRLNSGLSLMILTALRFIPFVFENYQMIRSSEKLKGYRFKFLSPIKSMKTEIKLLIPVFFSSLRNAKMVSIALIGRQIHLNTEVKSIHDKLPFKDRFILNSIAFVFATVISIKIMYWLYIYELFYVESLRPLYAFSRYYL
jgi:energy-coupling factor transport system permease protein